jgi:antitoxin component of MazEF toxin-antitoxin module
MYNVITMKAAIIKIGNSKGIRIPKVMLEESGIGKEVEIRAKKGEIKITSTAKKKKTLKFNEEYLLSISALDDWDSPEEDKAWASLQ